MTRDHIPYFAEIGFPLERIECVLAHLQATEQAWCFVDGQIVYRGFCERYIATAKDGKEKVTP